MSKKITSIFLMLVMIVTMVPTIAQPSFAGEISKEREAKIDAAFHQILWNADGYAYDYQYEHLVKIADTTKDCISAGSELSKDGTIEMCKAVYPNMAFQPEAASEICKAIIETNKKFQNANQDQIDAIVEMSKGLSRGIVKLPEYSEEFRKIYYGSSDFILSADKSTYDPIVSVTIKCIEGYARQEYVGEDMKNIHSKMLALASADSSLKLKGKSIVAGDMATGISIQPSCVDFMSENAERIFADIDSLGEKKAIALGEIGGGVISGISHQPEGKSALENYYASACAALSKCSTEQIELLRTIGATGCDVIREHPDFKDKATNILKIFIENMNSISTDHIDALCKLATIENRKMKNEPSSVDLKRLDDEIKDICKLTGYKAKAAGTVTIAREVAAEKLYEDTGKMGAISEAYKFCIEKDIGEMTEAQAKSVWLAGITLKDKWSENPESADSDYKAIPKELFPTLSKTKEEEICRIMDAYTIGVQSGWSDVYSELIKEINSNLSDANSKFIVNILCDYLELEDQIENLNYNEDEANFLLKIFKGEYETIINNISKIRSDRMSDVEDKIKSLNNKLYSWLEYINDYTEEAEMNNEAISSIIKNIIDVIGSSSYSGDKYELVSLATDVYAWATVTIASHRDYFNECYRQILKGDINTVSYMLFPATRNSYAEGTNRADLLLSIYQDAQTSMKVADKNTAKVIEKTAHDLMREIVSDERNDEEYEAREILFKQTYSKSVVFIKRDKDRVYYSSVKSAMQNATADSELGLIQNTKTADCLNKKVTLDLRGFTLSGATTNASNVTIENSHKTNKKTLDATGVYGSDISAFVTDGHTVKTTNIANDTVDGDIQPPPEENPNPPSQEDPELSEQEKIEQTKKSAISEMESLVRGASEQNKSASKLLESAKKELESANSEETIQKILAKYSKSIKYAMETNASKVRNLRVRALKNHTVRISFDRMILSNQKYVNKYQIYRKVGRNGKYKKLRTIYREKFSKRISIRDKKKLKKGKRYYYKVRAKKRLADGSYVLSDWSKARSTVCR